MQVSVHEISIASKPESPFYLKSEWTKDLGAGFVVLLCDGVSAWSGEVSEEDVIREAQEMEMPLEKYVHDLQVILTGEGQAEQSYSFNLEPGKSGGSTLNFSYEKVQHDMSFRFGTVELLPVPEPTKVIKELISYGLERSAYLRAKKDNVVKENKKLRNEQEHITAEMERYITEKESLEKELYNRFVLILNGKKAKIRDLQEQIKQLQNSIQEIKHGRKKGEDSHGGNELADEKSDYGNTTDEEGDGDLRTQSLNPGNQDVLAANPIEGDLNDLADVAPNRRRRRRVIQPLETDQPKKPVLVQRQTRRTELIEEEKANVNNDCPDPDDLFDDI